MMEIKEALEIINRMDDDELTEAAEKFEKFLTGMLKSEVKPKRKFKVGDIVVGNERASVLYSITSKGWKGIVKGI